jgi:hypothetical protein
MAGRVDKTGSGPGRTGASSVTRSPDRSLADHSTAFIGPTGQIMDTRRVEPICESDPINATLQPITNSRGRRPHHPCRSARPRSPAGTPRPA